jgi:predicted transposase YbfD/YdcC
VLPVSPSQIGFPHVVQLARLERIRELKGGKQEVQTVWLVSSLSSQQASPARLLELARQYWSIENGLHYRLDVSAEEDRCRVRHPVAATALGILRRAIQGEYRDWARHQRRPRASTYPGFREKMSRRINRIIRFVTGDILRL